MAAPVGLGGVDARQRLGALELIARVAVEVGHAARVQVHYRDVPVVRPAGEVAAQHEGWEEMQRQTVTPLRVETENVTHFRGPVWAEEES